MEVLLLTEFDDELPVGEWRCSMLGCPSQCYRREQRNDIDYILYLRWRYEDPWQAHIVKNAWGEDSMMVAGAIWSDDVFEQRNLFFGDAMVEEAKAALLEVWQEWEQ